MKNNNPALKISITGVFAALTLCISFIEKIALSGLPLPPGVKPGLGNIAVMLVCFIFGPVYAFGIIAIKAVFMLIVSGVTTSFISLCGGALGTAAMVLTKKILKDKAGCTGISVTGAVFHNIGQLTGASLLIGSSLYLTYAPVLLISGVVCGVLTGIIYSFTEPAVKKVFNKIMGNK